MLCVKSYERGKNLLQLLLRLKDLSFFFSGSCYTIRCYEERILMEPDVIASHDNLAKIEDFDQD